MGRIQIPEGPSKARDDYILSAVREGRAEFRFVPVVYLVNGTQVELEVFEDALKVDGVRVNVSAALQQQIADLLGCSLLTPMIADILWAQRVWTCSPKISKPNADMASTLRMIQHSQQIDQDLALQGYSGMGLVQTSGKHWILGTTITSNRARNYGWHIRSSSLAYAPATSWTGPETRVWQPPGLAHDPYHVDYSQVAVLVRRRVLVDGVEHDLSKMILDMNLRVFVSTEPNVSPRQPGVPQQPPLPGYEIDRVFVTRAPPTWPKHLSETPSPPSERTAEFVDDPPPPITLDAPPSALSSPKDASTSVLPSAPRPSPTLLTPLRPLTLIFLFLATFLGALLQKSGCS